MKIRALMLITLLAFAALAWVMLGKLMGTKQPTDVAGSGEPAAAMSSRPGVLSHSPGDGSDPTRASSPRSVTGSVPEPDGTIDGSAGTKQFERWWVPMSPEVFATKYAAIAEEKERSLAKYDTDGDGRLSKDERLLVLDAKTAALSEPEMIRYFDSDGDGELSEIERAEGDAVMRAKNSEFRAEMESQIVRGAAYEAERLTRFDADGDGRLNLDEAYEAYLDEVDTKAIDRFRGRYDANADGLIDAADLEAFMGLYADADARADANDDGAINERDIEAFEVMMSLPGAD